MDIIRAIMAFFGFGQAVAQDIGKAQDAAHDRVERNAGATSQIARTQGDELQAENDDRVRDSSDALGLRTRDDHGISAKP